MYEVKEGISMGFANERISPFKISQSMLIVITLLITKQNKKNQSIPQWLYWITRTKLDIILTH